MKERITYHGLIFCLGLIIFLPVLSYSQKDSEISKPSVKQPTGFIENKGQIIDQNNKPNPAVLYLLNTPGLNVQLKTTGFSYDIYTVDYTKNPHPKISGNHDHLNFKHPSDSLIPEYHFHRIDISLEGADPKCEIVSSETSVDYLNYYTSQTPVEGVTNVKQFRKVTYFNIYPKIDMELSITEYQNFEYTFRINPGGNINAIKIRISGADTVELKEDGYKLFTSSGNIFENIPNSYFQIDNGDKKAINASFKRISGNVFGFNINNNDIPPNATMVIDPYVTRIWGTYYGGSDDDADEGMVAVDKNHHVIIGGWTGSSNNIATAGAYQTSIAGGIDGFAAKMTANGQRIWGTYYGGELYDSFWAVCLDTNDNIFLSGVTESETGIATTGAHQTTNGGNQDAFLVKLNTNGQRVWATYYGGSQEEDSYSCSTDGLGNVVLAGYSGSDNNISTTVSFQPNRFGNMDAFIAKFDNNGTRLWGTYFGGAGNDYAFGCITDTNGVIFLAGNTESTLNIATPLSHQPLYGGGTFDNFLAAFTSNGQQRLWATYYGGTQEESGGDVNIDKWGSLYLTGNSKSDNGISTPGSLQSLSGGNLDAFLVKFRHSGQRVWGTYYGGNLDEYVYQSCISGNGDIFIPGTTSSTNNIATSGSFYPSYNGGSADGYIAKFDSLGM
ncbi:MAG: hypothetical protein WCL00_10300 [Bacteroidota bacterium]